MYKLSGFKENLNILNCLNLTGNWIHYMYGLFGLTKHLNSANTLNVWNCVNSTWNCVHNIYELFGYAENLNTQNSVNSMRNGVH